MTTLPTPERGYAAVVHRLPSVDGLPARSEHRSTRDLLNGYEAPRCQHLLKLLQRHPRQVFSDVRDRDARKALPIHGGPQIPEQPWRRDQEQVSGFLLHDEVFNGFGDPLRKTAGAFGALPMVVIQPVRRATGRPVRAPAAIAVELSFGEITLGIDQISMLDQPWAPIEIHVCWRVHGNEASANAVRNDDASLGHERGPLID